MRKRKAKEPRVEARVSLVGFDFSQPHAVPDRTTDRRHRQPSSDIPEAKPCRDSRRAWWAHPNRRMLCTPRIPTGAPSYPSTSTPGGAHARPAGGGAPHLLETSCLAFEYSILRACVDREGGSISRAGLDDPSGVGVELGAGERALRRPSASGRIFLPPDAESGMVTQSIDLAGFRIRVDRPRLAVSARDWGASPRGHEFSQQRR